MTSFDVIIQTGASKNPLNGLVEMQGLPVAEAGSYRFIPIDEVLALQTDGDYCRIFTAAGIYHQLLTLKIIPLRYFFRSNISCLAVTIS